MAGRVSQVLRVPLHHVRLPGKLIGTTHAADAGKLDGCQFFVDSRGNINSDVRLVGFQISSGNQVE